MRQDVVDVAALIDQHRVGKYQILVAALCAVAVFMDGFDVQMVGPVIPVIAKAMQVEPSSLWQVAVASLFGIMFGALGFGLLADRIGRKAIIVLCLAWFGLGMLLTPTASSIQGLVLWRFFTGFGLGGAMPNAIALTAEFAPEKSRATLVMVMFLGFSVGAAMAGFTTAGLIGNFGWQAVFYTGAALPIVFAPVLIVFLPESIRVLALKGGQDRSIAALLARIVPGSAFTPTTRFVMREEKTEGFPVRHLFRERRGPSTLLVWTMFFMNLLCLFFLTNWLPTVIAGQGLSREFGAAAAGIFQVGGCIGTLIFGPLIDRFGPFKLLAATYVGAALFIALVGVSGALAAPAAATVFAAGFCIIGGQNAMNALAATIYPTYIRSTGVGWALGIGRIGTLVGTIVGGKLLALHMPVAEIFAIMALPALVTAAATVLLSRAEARRLTAAEPARRHAAA